LFPCVIISFTFFNLMSWSSPSWSSLRNIALFEHVSFNFVSLAMFA
jgi:hypothetical protein